MMNDDMLGYDPTETPDAEWWLSLDEDTRNDLVIDHHRRKGIKLPNARAHAAFHTIVETQVAMGDELPVSQTLARLQAEGLDRHDAVHAICSVLADGIYDSMKHQGDNVDPNQAYFAALEKISAKSWRRAR